jgi:membrane-associated protein
LSQAPFSCAFVIDNFCLLPYTSAVLGTVGAVRDIQKTRRCNRSGFPEGVKLLYMVDFLLYFIDIFLHLDRHLADVLQYFGGWTYLVIFLIIFCETGLVVTPILPGDSLLFGLGAFAANPFLKGPLTIEMLLLTLSIAAIAGDSLNYAIGHYLGPRVFQKEDSRFFKRAYLEKTHQFYEKHGGKTIIIARFMPIIRTFAPFVAGIGRMSYSKFISYNVIGGIAWIFLFIMGGYFFGNIPFVKKNFTLVILSIIVISVMPGVIEYFRQKRMTAQR